MKKEFLKMAGVENESDFYKLFPTEEAFFGMFPEAKKLIEKKLPQAQFYNSQIGKPNLVDNTYVQRPPVDQNLVLAIQTRRKGETVDDAYSRAKKEREEAYKRAEKNKKIFTAKRNKEIVAQRQDKIAKSNAKENPLAGGFGILNPENWTRENWANTALEEKFRFFPNDVGGMGEVFDTYINPFTMVGRMGDALASAPLRAKQENSNAPYLSSIANPVFMGRMLGSGSINPLGKKFWTNTVSNQEFTNSLLMGVPGLVRAGATGVVNKAVVPLARKMHGLPAFKNQFESLPASQLKEMRAVQDIVRQKTTGSKSRDELIQLAIQQNLSDDAFQKAFGFGRKDAETILAGGMPQYRTQPPTGSIAGNSADQLAAPPDEISLDIDNISRARPSILSQGFEIFQQDLKRLPAALRNTKQRILSKFNKSNQNNYFPDDEYYQYYLNNSSFSGSTPQGVLESFDATMATPEGRKWLLEHVYPTEHSTYVSTYIPPERVDQWLGVYGHRSANDVRFKVPQSSAQLSLNQKAIRDVDRLGIKKKSLLDQLTEKAKSLTQNYAYSHPMYTGPVEQNIGLAALGRHSGKKDFYQQVKNVKDKSFPSGTVFTGSTNTSYNSWLPQTKEVFANTGADPVFLGFKPMNSMGFLSNAGYSNDEILKFINTELSDLIRRNKISGNIERPFIDEHGSIMLPHYGAKQRRYGGLIKAQEGKEYKGYSDEQLLEMMNNFQQANKIPIFGRPSLFNDSGATNNYGEVTNPYFTEEPLLNFLKRKELERKPTFQDGGQQYKGSSLVDYLATKGYQGSKQFRKGLAQEYGVENYDYSAAKNLELLAKLRENQEILSQHEQSFTPISVKKMEEMEEKAEAERQNQRSLPSKQKAKFQFDERKFNTMLDIITTPVPGNLRSPIPSMKISSRGKGVTGGGRKQQPKASDPVQEGEYDVQEKPQLQVQKQEAPGFTDYLNLAANVIMPGLFNPFNAAKTIYNVGSEAVQDVKDFGTQAINYGKRQYNLYTGSGDELSKTKSEIKIPKVAPPPKTNKEKAKKTSKLVIDGMPYAEGNKINMEDKSERYYTKPLWLDLNSPTLKLGARNRGSRLGNIKSEGFVITPFAKEYGMGDDYDDGKGTSSIRQYKDNEIVDDKIYGGVDNNGTFYLDYGKNLKGKNLQMADFRSFEVTGIAKNKKGKYIYGDATDNKKVARTAKALDEQGKPTVDLNLLIPKASIQTGHESFGAIGGGRYILSTPDLTKKVLVAGSLKNIDQYIEDFKKSTGSKVVKMIPLDNGTFARGLATKDGIITDEDQANYDNFNNKGGAAFYLLNKKHGGPILPKAQFYNSIIGGLKPITFQPQPLTLTPKLGETKGGFAPFSLSGSTFSGNASADMGIPDCGEGGTWDAINQKCVPKEGYTELNDSVTGKSTFIKSTINYTPQNEALQEGWENETTTPTTTKPPKYLFGNVGKWFDKHGAGLRATAGALNQGFAFGTGLAAEKNFREAMRNQKKSLRNKLFTQAVMPEGTDFMGDYTDTPDFRFRPNQYTVNKGMFTSNMPGSRVAKFGGPIMQIGGGIMGEQLVTPEAEFSPIITPEMSAPAMSSAPEETETKAYKHSGANPIVEKAWDEVSKQFSGVKFLGIWGDKSHQARKSDHNTGNALDIGILNIEQGEEVANKLISEANDKRIKYLIFNRKIWSPESGWKTYTPTKANGNNPHTSHVHVSFYPYEGNKNVKKSGESIAVSHNNPGNIHFGNYTSQWGAEKGARDSDGNVAIFNSIEDGWDAMNKLLFSPNYNNLTVVGARNKWVTGKPNTMTDSSKFIAKELGVDGSTRVADLSPEQKLKLASLFVKYEDNRMYKKLKDLKYFEMGGQVGYNEGEEYDLTEDEIRQILEQGGDIEYI